MKKKCLSNSCYFQKNNYCSNEIVLSGRGTCDQYGQAPVKVIKKANKKDKNVVKSKNSKKEILIFIGRNKDKSSETIKELLVKEFGIAQRTATDYLRLYRREHKEEAKKEVKKRAENIINTTGLEEIGKIFKGKYGEYKIIGSKVVIGE